MYSVLDVAKYVIFYSNEKKYDISNLKLQKILYFIQAEFLVSENEPCFYEEIEAWNFGPVVPEVYHVYKIFGGSNIYIRNFNKDKILQKDRELIEAMVDECAKYSPSRLVEITHNQAPWKNAYIRGVNNIITKESIKCFFS